MTGWLEIERRDAPLIVAMPHTGSTIPPEIEARMASPWLARRDADWHIEKLYAFAGELGATTVRTAISRSVIDVNRDPSGASLYPGKATTGLCPLTTFDGDPLYRDGEEPGEAEVAERRARWFDPYHAAIAAEIERLRAAHGRVVLYDAHAILSRVPRLFEGELPHLNIGTFDGASCDPALTRAVEAAAGDAPFARVTDGRFKGGWTTRHYGRPAEHVHAIQMELSFRGFLDEPGELSPDSWPPRFDPARAADLQAVLRRVLAACLDFARSDR